MKIPFGLQMTVDSVGCCLSRWLKPHDVSHLYIDSLNAEKYYVETKAKLTTMESQKNYVQNVAASKDSAIAGLFVDGVYLVASAGMQKLQTSEATLGIFVFDGWRGLGLGKTIVWATCQIITRLTGITCYAAGMKKDNASSLKSFLGCGFRQVSEADGCCQVACTTKELRRPGVIDADYKWCGLPVVNNGNTAADK
jgi:RimJ/RimL family protein N-acetyltransferase